MNYTVWGVLGLLLITIETQASEPLIEVQGPYYPRNADASLCHRKTDIKKKEKLKIEYKIRKSKINKDLAFVKRIEDGEEVDS